MEQGSLRCDANVSLRRSPTDPLGTRTETKNVNSLRSVERAVRYEMTRQAAVLEAGGKVVQETRHWHEDTGVTTSGREKSDAEDYRYFPEPDLVPIAPSREWVEELRASCRRTRPCASRASSRSGGSRRSRWRRSSTPGRSTSSSRPSPRGPPVGCPQVVDWGARPHRATSAGVELADLPITPADVARVEALVGEGALNDKLARQVIEGVLAGEGTPDEVVAARGLAVVSDDGPLLAAIDDALAAQPDVADKIRGGKVAAAGAIVGAVMKATRGQADAARVRELLLERLGVSE